MAKVDGQGREGGSTPWRQLWIVLKEAFIEFVWADVRDGMIDLHGLAPALKLIILLGFGITVLCLVLLTQAPALRAYFPLYTSITPEAGRGLHIPLILFPVSLFLLTLAWAYVLTGARRSHWLIHAGVVAFYLLSISSWLPSLLSTYPDRVIIAATLCLVIFISTWWSATLRMPTVYYFAFMLICVGSTFVTMQTPLVLQDQASGLPVGKTVLESNLRSLTTIAIPLLILLGFDIADFGLHASTWITKSATTIVPTRLLPILTFGLLVWLGWHASATLSSRQTGFAGTIVIYPLIGACTLLLLLWLIWWGMERFFPASSPLTMEAFSESAHQLAVVLVIAFSLPLLSSYLLLEVAQVVESVAIELQSGLYGNFSKLSPWTSSFYASATSFSSFVTSQQRLWQEGCAVLAIVFALLLFRHKHRAAGIYLITAGVNYLWVEVTRPGQWLEAFGWSALEPIVLAWTLCIVLVASIQLMRQRFTQFLQQCLLVATVAVALLGQTSLIASPLAPIFSLAGVGYLALGMGWDLLSSGSWANIESKFLPRVSRIFLYLGYVLMTVMLVNWAVASHDYTLLDRFTGEAALTGLVLLGYPYLYALLYLTLSGAFGALDFVTTVENDSHEPG